MPSVSCTVNNCKHWDMGNACTAKQIVVQKDTSGGLNSSSGGSLTQMAATPAQSADEACCQTFVSSSSMT